MSLFTRETIENELSQNTGAFLCQIPKRTKYHDFFRFAVSFRNNLNFKKGLELRKKNVM